MNKKRSNDNPSLSSQTKRLKVPFAAQGSSSNTTAPSFNVHDQFAALPSGSFMPQMDTPNSAYHPPLPQSTVNQGMIQSQEVNDSRFEDLVPSCSDVDWDAIAAMEEYYQSLQDTQMGGYYSQYTQSAEEIPAHSGANALSGIGGSLFERSPRSGGGYQVLNEQGAFLGPFANPILDVSRLGTSTHDPYNSGRDLTQICNVSHNQTLYTADASEPLVTQFPIQNMLQRAQKVDISGNPRFMNIARDHNVTNHWHDGTRGLEGLKRSVSFAAQFDSSAQDPERVCHPGTRENVLERIKNWIDNPCSTEPIFWLHGPAGAGKSAIAQTIATSCGQQKVAATFFFYRSDANRNDGNLLFTTLAYQLAFSIPAIKDFIVQSLYERPDLPTKSVEIQFNDLIVLPFRSLSKAASQRSSPNSLIAAFNKCQQSAPVMIIDGVDECEDEGLQRRFLKIIGDAVKNRSFPFRFLICSRPEAHIEETLNKFKASTLLIDLAKLDDSNHDIEKYVVDKFSSIASERHLGPSWPGRVVIDDIIYKSSGNFIFAAVVIKFASDKDSMAEEQIAIIMNLRPPDRMSPFAVLDELYLQILKRQFYPEFLKTFLALLVGRTTLSRRGSNPHDDDAKLMDVSKEELHVKLRRMRSLLKFEPHIDVHHRSFLDFLKESSRSGDYHISTKRGTRRYLELVVDSIVRHISRMIQDPDHHESHHFNLAFWMIAEGNPLKADLSMDELHEVLQPLVEIQDDILKSTDYRVASDLLTCRKCAIFRVMRPLLFHLAIRRCIHTAYNDPRKSASKEQSSHVKPSIQTGAIGNELDSILYSLLTQLRMTKLELSSNTGIITDTYSILRFDCADITVKLRSTSDAQRLVDFMVHLIDERSILSQYKPDGPSKAAMLVLKIFARIPVLPQTLFQNVERIASGRKRTISDFPALCEAALMSRVLDQNYIHLEMKLKDRSPTIYDNCNRLFDWGRALPLDSNVALNLALEVARIIQYLHSMGVALNNDFHLGNVHFNPSLRLKVRIDPLYLNLINPSLRCRSRYFEDSVLAFGRFFRYIIDAKCRTIPEHVRQLMECCCAKDPKNRPTIDKIVEEMENMGRETPELYALNKGSYQSQPEPIV